MKRGGRIARVGSVLALGFAIAVAACVDGDSPTRSGTSGIGGGAAALLVGQWSRTVVFDDDGGDIHSSRTVWRFEADSGAKRMVIATSVAAGITDTVSADARWEATPTQVTIDFQQPDSGTVTFPYQVHLSTLTLGGVEFVRDE
jgi:hypothetical protein